MTAGPIRLNAAHSEQVTALPPGAEVLGGNAGCPVGFIAMGKGVFTTQYHPEITDSFMAALVEEYAPQLSRHLGKTARLSLANPADALRMAGWIIAFFEQA